MKLKNIAALVFRIIGAWIIFGGFEDAGVSMVEKESSIAIADIILGFIFGICIILFSKKLAGLFCRGLDDDAA
jgi:hypothetical protein